MPATSPLARRYSGCWMRWRTTRGAQGPKNVRQGPPDQVAWGTADDDQLDRDGVAKLQQLMKTSVLPAFILAFSVVVRRNRRIRTRPCGKASTQRRRPRAVRASTRRTVRTAIATISAATAASSEATASWRNFARRAFISSSTRPKRRCREARPARSATRPTSTSSAMC